MSEGSSRPGATLGPPNWIFAVFALLFALVVPWYGATLFDARALVLGLPAWVFASLCFSLAAALFTAFVIHRLWRDRGDEGGDGRGAGDA